MFKFIYSICAWCLTHYDELPPVMREKFPKEAIKETTITLSVINQCSTILKDFGYE